jgi:NAD+ synthase (glutamine-hydrolysing)
VPPRRIALAQVNPTVGDLAGNAARIREATAAGRRAGAALVVFPELALCGYPPRDFLDMPEFLDRTARALAELAAPGDWSRGVALVVGFAEAAADAPPPGVYNAAALIEDGRVVAVGRKSLLPTYDVFDETRYFVPAAGVTAARSAAAGATLGLSVCEDIWNDKRFWQKPRYQRDPIGELEAAGASLIVNVSASPYGMGKPALRERMVAAAAAGHGTPIAYVNQVGGNDALVFDGGSMLLGRDGAVLARGPLFEEAVVVAGEDGSAPEVLPLAGGAPLRAGPGEDAEADEVYRALVLGLRDYARKCRFSRAVIGLSGGIDSALTACLAADALGAAQVFGVAMPSRYSSRGSRDDAAALARNLGVRFAEIAIEPMHAAYLAQVGGALGRPLGDLAEQNVQARIRGQILMAISNDEGSLCLSTGNKSELAVGYCTLYGDMAGGLAVIGDLPKTLVYRVARAANARAGRAVIPEATFTKPPSAELKPDQTDQDTLPPYDELDDILAAYIEERLSADAIAARGHAPETVRRVLGMVIGSEYKRRQAAPALKVTAKAFGEGRRLPIAHGFRHEPGGTGRG